jgi:DNA-directed RNA polymerase subunit alpha
MFKIELIQSAQNDYNEQYGKFSISNLKAGQGITLGSSLRRVLLSDLTGTSIVAIRIASLNNEFFPIEGLREDILEIILNVKEIVLEGDIENSKKWVLGRLKVNGPKVINAGLIEFEKDSNIRVINPNHYIATIAENSMIEMEFLVERGNNYRLVDSIHSNNYPTDFLEIDAVFMPVRKVNYEVEKIETNQPLTNNFYPNLSPEKLILEIWTNGSISPIKALVLGSSILENMSSAILLEIIKMRDFDPTLSNSKLSFSNIEEKAGWKKIPSLKNTDSLLDFDNFVPLRNFDEETEIEIAKCNKELYGTNFEEEIEEIKKKKLLSENENKLLLDSSTTSNINQKDVSIIPIEELALSARAYNGLKRAQINCVGDLIKYSIKDLKEIKNFGQKSLNEVVSALKNLFDINLI